MRIVIDMQGAQTESRYRGIGRYTTSIVKEMLKNKRDHEIILCFNGSIPNDSVSEILEDYGNLVDKSKIRIWHTPSNIVGYDSALNHVREAAEYIREAFLASLNPDAVLISNLFEGYGDCSVTSINRYIKIPTAIILHDLIPLAFPKDYLEVNSAYDIWFQRKLESFKCAQLFLANSEYSANEGRFFLNDEKAKVVTVSGACSPIFRKKEINSKSIQILKFHGIHGKYIMYTGGADSRKNLGRLIEAYALLSSDVRKNYQLIIVGKMPDGIKSDLLDKATSLGILPTELLLTGYVSDDDLVDLYNSASVFVFPSLHEGFGLPALEAMQCDAPVIAGNTSALVEVVGNKDALFDPRKPEEISAKIHRVLTDSTFKKQLLDMQRKQVSKFSWKSSAEKALKAIEDVFNDCAIKKNYELVKKPTLAFVSKKYRYETGLFSYCVIQELNKFYNLDVVSDEPSEMNAWLRANCGIRSVHWFSENADRYDRILYHIENKPDNRYIYELCLRYQGVVISSDYCMDKLYIGEDKKYFKYKNHGYAAINNRFLSAQNKEFPCNHELINAAMAFITHSQDFCDQYTSQKNFSKVNLKLLALPSPPLRVNALIEAQYTKMGNTDAKPFTILISHGSDLNATHGFVECWYNSELYKNEDFRLIIACPRGISPNGSKINNLASSLKLFSNIQVKDCIDNESYVELLLKADCAVEMGSDMHAQLTILNYLNYGIHTVVNINCKIDPSAKVTQKADSYDAAIKILSNFGMNGVTREPANELNQDYLRLNHNAGKLAADYHQFIEGIYSYGNLNIDSLLTKIATTIDKSCDNSLLESLSECIEITFHDKVPNKKLYIDVSSFMTSDVRTGIQRVFRSLFLELLSEPPNEYSIEPVYSDGIVPGYKHARRFMFSDVNISDQVEDSPIAPQLGDIFLSMDIQPIIAPMNAAYFQALKNRGVIVKFIVHDLIPVLYPKYYPEGTSSWFSEWLGVVAKSSGAICVSKTVANELANYIKEKNISIACDFKINWFHNGANIDVSIPSTGVSSEISDTLKLLRGGINFIMVSTVEPRKGHFQVLRAFTKLWEKGININLVIIGKLGWMMDAFVDAVKTHPMNNKKLFWIQNASDEALERFYTISTCLISASEAEGFGLPLIEAAQHNLPIIARDVPVFREVVGENAYFFKGDTPEVISEAVQDWLVAFNAGKHPISSNIQWITWAESAKMLKSFLG